MEDSLESKKAVTDRDAYNSEGKNYESILNHLRKRWQERKNHI